MSRKLIFFLVAALIVSLPLAADESEHFPSPEEINQVMQVITDCFSASLAATYSEEHLELPSCSVSINTETYLPSRIAFFLANPYEFQLILKNEVAPQKNLLSAILSLLQNQKADPLLSATYINLSSKNYQSNSYYVNGYINLMYPENTTLNDLSQFLLSREYTENSIKLNLSLNVVKVSGNPVSVTFGGNFEMSVKEDGTINVSSLDSYTINGRLFEAGSFSF